VLDSLDDSETMAIIRESVGEFEGDFFDTMSSEIERYQTAGDTTTADRLERIARAIASVRQNRTENL